MSCRRSSRLRYRFLSSIQSTCRNRLPSFPFMNSEITSFPVLKHSCLSYLTTRTSKKNYKSVLYRCKIFPNFKRSLGLFKAISWLSREIFRGCRIKKRRRRDLMKSLTNKSKSLVNWRRAWKRCFQRSKTEKEMMMLQRILEKKLNSQNNK